MSGAELISIKSAYFLACDVYYFGKWTYRTVKSASHRDQELQVLQRALRDDLEILKSFINLFLRNPESCVGAPMAPVNTALENLHNLYSSQAATLALPELQQDSQYLAFKASHTRYLTEGPSSTIGFVIEDVDSDWDIELPTTPSGPLVLPGGTPTDTIVAQNATVTTNIPSRPNMQQRISNGVKWVARDRRNVQRLHNDAREQIYAIRDNTGLFHANQIRIENEKREEQERIDREQRNAQMQGFLDQLGGASLGLENHMAMRQLTGTDTPSGQSNTRVSEIMAELEDLTLDPEYTLESPESSTLCKGTLINGKKEREQVLVEYKKWRASSGDDSDEDHLLKTEREIKNLAKLLTAARGAHFPTLSLRGYINQESNSRYAFVFDYPKGTETTPPITLHDIISQRNFQDGAGSFPMRFQVAQALIKRLGAIHADGWLHKSVCSQSVVFFRNQSSQPMYLEPYLVNFEYARPLSDDTYFDSNEDVERLAYMHPDRLKNQRRKFCVEHDLYSLGVVLLEIGLWKTAASIVGDGLREAQKRDMEAAGELQRKEFIAAAENPENLSFHLGHPYAEAVGACLSEKAAKKLKGAMFGKKTITSAIELVSFKSLQENFKSE